MDSLSRMIGIFDLFEGERTVVTVEEVAAALDCSVPTAYRYLKTLSTAGLIAPGIEGGFGLGARIIQLDRQIRLNDPLLHRAGDVMERLIGEVRGNLMVCASYGKNVVCIAQAWPDRTVLTSYDRGRPMPLLRGAAGKAILANLPDHRLRSLMLANAAEIAAAGLGRDWAEFRKTLKAIRKQGYAVSVGEVDERNAGIAAPILSPEKRSLGCLVLVVPRKEFDEATIPDIGAKLIAGARAISG
ncbi:IclR family transcriptional regulator [Kaistia geumhonensis]|uniref:DNA-binding IclR family transcriptional regulator n=1 Tax=Kaistia geumhonensis TaxID=410839 RepID=A0ABU0M2S0_9HYPH|nr:IclR family transcriptional regulator [Kaistia geumhonensis]MCX5479604.1 IclR family transcriptional regulator [Kaistia geumhonensis]MDQ0515173.1 DNA-binding IclR family transcriptional regulator [Kaistia geumhonensis]